MGFDIKRELGEAYKSIFKFMGWIVLGAGGFLSLLIAVKEIFNIPYSITIFISLGVLAYILGLPLVIIFAIWIKEEVYKKYKDYSNLLRKSKRLEKENKYLKKMIKKLKRKKR